MVRLLSESLQVRWLEAGSRGDLNLIKLSDTLCIRLQNIFELFLGEWSSFQEGRVFLRVKPTFPGLHSLQHRVNSHPSLSKGTAEQMSCIRAGKRKGEKKNKIQGPKTPEFLHTHAPPITALLRLLLPPSVKLLRDKTALKSEKSGKEMRLLTLLLLISSKLFS